ncbi:MAG: hypothetical protein ACTSYA_05545 [Candidatus Kariarchaeaceae archaeon]
MEQKNVEKLSRVREEEAKKYSSNEIHSAVMRNILNLDVEIDAKGDLLISTIPDLSFILRELRKWKENEVLSNPDYYKLVECALLNNLTNNSLEMLEQLNSCNDDQSH